MPPATTAQMNLPQRGSRLQRKPPTSAKCKPPTLAGGAGTSSACENAPGAASLVPCRGADFDFLSEVEALDLRYDASHSSCLIPQVGFVTFRNALELRSKQHRRVQNWLFVVIFVTLVAAACWLLT